MLVKGGPTNAGSKRGKHEQVKQPWLCANEHGNPYYATNCLTAGCREKRP